MSLHIKSYRFLYSLLFIFSTVMVGELTFQHSVSASSIPPDIQAQAVSECNTATAEYGSVYWQAQISWVSPVGNPAVDSSATPVSSGNTVNLQWNVGNYWCYGAGNHGTDPTYVEATNFNPKSATTTGGTVTIQVPPAVNCGQTEDCVSTSVAWSQGAIPLVLSPQPTASSVTITINWQAINQFPPNPNGIYECVGADVGPPTTYARGYHRHSISDFNGGFPCGVQSTSYMVLLKPSGGGPPPPPPPPPPLQPPCPTPPWLSPYSTVDVNLPNAPQPAGTSPSAPSGPSTSPDQYYYQATPGQWEITQAHDQYASPTSITWQPQGYQSSSQFTMDYSHYVFRYQYDDHVTTIYYNQHYTQTQYVSASSPSYYQCNGYTSSTSTCWQTDYYYSGCETYDATTNTCTTYWPCSSPYSGTNGNCYYTYSYQGTAMYDYNSGTPAPTLTSSTTYSGAPTLPEICPRNYNVLPPSNTDVTQVSLYGPSPDQPNQVTVQTNTTVNFMLLHGYNPAYPIRHPMQVNGINYLGTYLIEHADHSPPTPVGPTPDHQDFNIGSTYQDNGDVSHPYPSTFGVSMPPLEVGDQVCAEFTDTPKQGEMDENGNQISGSGSQDSSRIPQVCSGPVTDIPYTRFYGNDVISGIKFAGSPLNCNPSSAGLVGYSSGGTRARGTGSQFAAMSLGQISYFASAFLRSASANPTSVNGLSFANTTGGYGGYFNSSSSGCPTLYNYYAQKTTNNNIITNVHPGGNTYDVSTVSGQAQISMPGSVLTITGNSIQGVHVLYVNGDVYIPSNLNFGTNGSFDTTTGKVSNVPSLYIIALGNIYIGPGVTHLDGVYVAENQCDAGGTSCGPASGGIINTCSYIPNNNAPANPTGSFSTGTLYSACDNQLTVTGALVAHDVKLERAHASFRNSKKGENPLSGSIHDCSVGNGPMPQPSAPDCSAEVFNFDPGIYLGDPNFGASQKNNYDQALSLPPVL